VNFYMTLNYRNVDEKKADKSKSAKPKDELKDFTKGISEFKKIPPAKKPKKK
jgi:hypothetical protein